MSLASPLLVLAIYSFVFSVILGSNIPHFKILLRRAAMGGTSSPNR